MTSKSTTPELRDTRTPSERVTRHRSAASSRAQEQPHDGLQELHGEPQDEPRAEVGALSSPRDLLTPAQLADRWGMTTGHLANLRHQGEGIGYLKLGCRIAYRFTDVLDFENAHYVSPS